MRRRARAMPASRRDDAKLAAAVGPALAAGSLNVAQAEIPFAIRDGQVRVSNTTLTGEGARLNLSGGYDIAADQIDVRAALSATATDAAAIGRPEILLLLFGSPDKPDRSDRCRRAVGLARPARDRPRNQAARRDRAQQPAAESATSAGGRAGAAGSAAAACHAARHRRRATSRGSGGSRRLRRRHPCRRRSRCGRRPAARVRRNGRARRSTSCRASRSCCCWFGLPSLSMVQVVLHADLRCVVPGPEDVFTKQIPSAITGSRASRMPRNDRAQRNGAAARDVALSMDVVAAPGTLLR